MSEKRQRKAKQHLGREAQRAEKTNETRLPDLDLLTHLPEISILRSIFTREQNQRHVR